MDIIRRLLDRDSSCALCNVVAYTAKTFCGLLRGICVLFLSFCVERLSLGIRSQGIRLPFH